MNRKIEHLLVEFRELMIIRRSLPPSPSRKKVKERLSEIMKELVDNHWEELPESIIKRLDLKPRKKKDELQTKKTDNKKGRKVC